MVLVFWVCWLVARRGIMVPSTVRLVSWTLRPSNQRLGLDLSLAILAVLDIIVRFTIHGCLSTFLFSQACRTGLFVPPCTEYRHTYSVPNHDELATPPYWTSRVRAPRVFSSQPLLLPPLLGLMRTNGETSLQEGLYVIHIMQREAHRER